MQNNIRQVWKSAAAEQALLLISSVMMLGAVAGKALTPTGLNSDNDMLGAFIMSGLGMTFLTVAGVRTAVRVRAMSQRQRRAFSYK
jgi:hypothetical protein